MTLVLHLIGSGLVGGCAVNGVGAVGVAVTRGEDAVVVETTTLGLGLDLRTDDPLPGLSLGLQRRRMLFSLADAGHLAEGRFWFTTPELPGPPLLTDRRVAGMAVGGRPDGVGLTLGLADLVLLGPFGEGRDIRVRYDTADPGAAIAQNCKKGAAC